MTEAESGFSKCKAYEGYCQKYGKCIGLSQLERDISHIKNKEKDVPPISSLKRYVLRCYEKGCQFEELGEKLKTFLELKR